MNRYEVWVSGQNYIEFAPSPQLALYRAIAKFGAMVPLTLGETLEIRITHEGAVKKETPMPRFVSIIKEGFK